MTNRKFNQMQTEEQRYAVRRAAALRGQANQHERRANASAKQLLSAAWDRTVSDDEFAPSRQERAIATRLREQADQLEAEAQPQPKKKWGLF